LASYLAGLRITKRNISATILADVKRFFHQINTDEVFGTHNEADSRRQSTQCLPAELQEIEPDLPGACIQALPARVGNRRCSQGFF
jgi:dTDP-D-glucose 4,6-dehydratase